MARKKRLLVGPAVADTATLESLVVRLAHYLAHVDVDRIEIAVTPELAESRPPSSLTSPALPPGIDAEVLSRVPTIAPKISLKVLTASSVEPTADFLLFWDVGGREVEPWQSLAKRYRQNQTKFDIDWSNTRADGSWSAELALVLSKPSRAYDPSELERFRRRTEDLGGSPKAYLVATGPSARDALDADLSDGVRIVCNTAILDAELLDHVSPHIVTFADPIFHFGPSTYAHEFQRALDRAAARHDFTIVTLERFAHLLRDRLPHLADRIVGVRLAAAGSPQNYDLLANLAVRPYPNIMTMLMLPLATTFSRSIDLFGFDGRDPRENYFWRHGSTVQFDRELIDIRQAHPGFFRLDYADYYDQHESSVEQMLLDIELRGGVITPRSLSYLRPLRRRRISDRPAIPTWVPRRPPIVSVTPDWTGSFGHFGPWERAMATAARGLGYDYCSLASRALEPPDVSAIPTFTLGTLNRESSDPQRFERELRTGLRHTVGDAAAIVCFYAADVWQLAGVLAVAAERPTTTFAVNLMRAHAAVAELQGGAPGVSGRLLRECLDIARDTNVHVCFDTDAIASDLEATTGHRVPTWPMIMLGDPMLFEQHGKAATRGRPVRVVAPVHAHIVKGFPEVVAVAERLHDSMLLGRLRLTARFVHQPGGVTNEHTALAERFRAAGGDLVTDNLSDAQYAALVGQAHAILLPYRVATFRTRTSGVLLDAIAAGKPVLAVRGTWAGDLVERSGTGVVYDDRDVDSLETSIHALVAGIDEYTERAQHQRDRLIAAFRPQRLVTFLASLARVRNAPPAATRLAALRALVQASVDATWGPDVRRADARIGELIEVDDLRRGRDDLFDKIEELRKVIAWNQREVARLNALTGTPVVAPAVPAPADDGPAKRDPPARPSTPPAPAFPDSLDANVFDRSAGAHLDELALVAALVDPAAHSDGIMVDVGAHRGSAFRPFHQAGWTVYAFEPDPRHVEHLRKTHAEDPRVILDTRAVSNRTGLRVPFYVSEESTGISGLSAFRESHETIGDVETVALRDVAGLTRADVLKIDTEGYELFVLEGYPFERAKPAVIVAEFEDSKTKPLGYETADLVGFLRARGYQVWVSEWHPIVRYGIRHQWRRLVDSASDAPDPLSWGNLIALATPVPTAEMGRALASVLTIKPLEASTA